MEPDQPTEIDPSADLHDAELTRPEPEPALPTMDDLDRLTTDLDRIDETLAALDRDGDHPDPSATQVVQPA